MESKTTPDLGQLCTCCRRNQNFCASRDAYRSVPDKAFHSGQERGDHITLAHRMMGKSQHIHREQAQ